MEFNKETLIAFVRLLVSVILGVGTVAGWSLDADLVFNILVSIAAFGSFVYTWWKNNNVTKAAQTAQGWLDELKDLESEQKSAEDNGIDPLI